MKGLYFGSSPSSVWIHLTNKCNQHCIYCEIGQGLVKTEKPLLTFQDTKWMIDEMEKAKIPSLSLGGGEPLLFKEMFEIIRYAHERGIECTVLTNGMLLDRLSQDQIDTFRECKTTVSVSIDSFSNEKQELIRGVSGALTQPIKGLEKLTQNDINVNICAVISSYNYGGLFDLVKRADELNVHNIKFQPIIFVSNYPETDPIHNKKCLNVLPEHLPKIKKQFELISSYQKKSKISTNVNLLEKWFFDYMTFLHTNRDDLFFKKALNRFWCAQINNVISINYYGKILPCSNMPNLTGESIHDPGNKSLLDLWNDSANPIREDIKNGRFPKECASCVCAFDENLIGSTLRYPIANRENIPAVCKKGLEKLFTK